MEANRGPIRSDELDQPEGPRPPILLRFRLYKGRPVLGLRPDPVMNAFILISVLPGDDITSAIRAQDYRISYQEYNDLPTGIYRLESVHIR